jgi:hypothetical protein
MERRPSRLTALAAAALALLVAAPALAKTERDPSVPRQFQRENPCPVTGKRSGPCPGYQRDHIVPLACGGPDSVSNMQWLTIEAARIKDREALRACRGRRG